jgi:hypothetical protein
MIALAVMCRYCGWSRGFCRRRRQRRLAGGLVHRWRDGRLMVALRVMGVLSAGVVLDGLFRLSVNGLLFAMCIVGGGPVVLALRVPRGCPVMTTIGAR